MTRSANMTRINELRRQNTQAFIAEYWHFKGYGWDDRRYDTFCQRLRRNGIQAEA